MSFPLPGTLAAPVDAAPNGGFHNRNTQPEGCAGQYRRITVNTTLRVVTLCGCDQAVYVVLRRGVVFDIDLLRTFYDKDCVSSSSSDVDVTSISRRRVAICVTDRKVVFDDAEKGCVDAVRCTYYGVTTVSDDTTLGLC